MKHARFLMTALIAFALCSLGCQGKKGDPGAPGGGRVTATMNCSGTISGLVGGAAALNGLMIEYNAVLTSGGDVYATANIIDEVIQLSGTSFYAAGQVGSSTAQVTVTADFIGTANGGYWSVSLNRNNLVTSIVYDDLSLPAPVKLTFKPSACTVGAF